MKRKKIILASNMIWTIAQFRLGLISALTDAGYEVVCVADTDRFSDFSEPKIESAGGRFVRLPVRRQGMNPIHEISYFFRFLGVLKREKPDLLINYTVKPIVYGSLAAAMLNIPSLAVTTGLGFVFTRNNLLTHITKFLYRFSLRFPRKVFFLNPDDRKTLVGGDLLHPEKAALLPSEGVDTAYYSPDEAGTAEKPFTFLMIARLLVEKGVGEYVKAAKMLKESHGKEVVCNLIGPVDDDNPGGIHKRLIWNWHSEGLVNYLGTTEDIRPFISASDCVVLPSYREGVPRTLMEAASMAKPLIASNAIGCREVVEHDKNGFLCKVRDHQDLYDKMVKMVSLTEMQRSEMGNLGREKMLNSFDERIVIQIYLDELKHLGI